MAANTIYTIGHSVHPIETFLELLELHNINCVIDVRSTPYSRVVPQYNKPQLSRVLKSQGILYSHFGKEFGARHTDLDLLNSEGKVDFKKVRETDSFKQGIQRLHNGLEMNYNISLMCSEANPFDCHRFVMISYQLAKENLDVQHILTNGNILKNSILEEMLIKKYFRKLPQNSLFDGNVTIEAQIDYAYMLRNKDIGYSEEDLDQKELS